MLITNKLLNRYYYAKKQGISVNDNYNKKHFGILQEQYQKIQRIEQDVLGICGGRMTLKEAKRNQ